MSIKKRLDLVIKELRLSGRGFEKEVGWANGSYSSIGDGVGADKLNKIFFKFPQISVEWLLTGEGEMMKKSAGMNLEESGAIFAGLEGMVDPNDPLNRDDMKTILFQMANIVAAQQQDISRVAQELERNGKRTDRILQIIEGGMAHDDEAAPRRTAIQGSGLEINA